MSCPLILIGVYEVVIPSLFNQIIDDYAKLINIIKL